MSVPAVGEYAEPATFEPLTEGEVLMAEPDRAGLNWLAASIALASEESIGPKLLFGFVVMVMYV
jgi:hypothetical protein